MYSDNPFWYQNICIYKSTQTHMWCFLNYLWRSGKAHNNAALLLYFLLFCPHLSILCQKLHKYQGLPLYLYNQVRLFHSQLMSLRGGYRNILPISIVERYISYSWLKYFTVNITKNRFPDNNGKFTTNWKRWICSIYRTIIILTCHVTPIYV